MSFFVIGNLGDAGLTLPTGTVNAGGTVNSGGFLFVNNTSGGPITLTIANALVPFLLIKDVAGNAGAHAVTIACSAGIDQVTSVVFNTNFQKVWILWNGTSYSIIG